MEPVNNFLTVESLETLGGVTLATIVVSNTFRAIFKKDPKIFALVFSVGICVLFAVYSSAEPINYLVAVVNGCLVFCSAYGLNNQVIRVTSKSKKAQSVEGPGGSDKDKPGGFFDLW
jgi:hypothetical protein